MALRGCPICKRDELPLLHSRSNICVCVLTRTLNWLQTHCEAYKVFNLTFNYIELHTVGEVQHNPLLVQTTE